MKPTSSEPNNANKALQDKLAERAAQDAKLWATRTELARPTTHLASASVPKHADTSS